mmetsp:Transcript_20309/g.50775  ORF Transcript_20309/g.50775 Transcript_20309/m.50775 type:complete len:207 (-) Transcript_20309:587-1207(-)
MGPSRPESCSRTWRWPSSTAGWTRRWCTPLRVPTIASRSRHSARTRSSWRPLGSSRMSSTRWSQRASGRSRCPCRPRSPSSRSGKRPACSRRCFGARRRCSPQPQSRRRWWSGHRPGPTRRGEPTSTAGAAAARRCCLTSSSAASLMTSQLAGCTGTSSSATPSAPCRASRLARTSSRLWQICWPSNFGSCFWTSCSSRTSRRPFL